MDRQQRLRIAVQKSGRLTDESLDLLQRCGLKFSRGKDQLMCYGENMPLDVLFVRDDDIPGPGPGGRLRPRARRPQRARGKAPGDARARHARRASRCCRSSTYGRCRLALAVPDDFVFDGLQSIAGKRIATTYPHVLARFLQEQGDRRRDRHAVRAPSRSRRASAAPT